MTHLGIRRYCMVVLVAVAGVGEIHAQTAAQREQLLEFARRSEVSSRQQRAEAESLALVLGIPVLKEGPNGEFIELQKFVDGRPYYFITQNLAAAQTISTSKAWPGGGGGFSLTGSTDTLGVWDANRARATHQELTGRVILSDGATSGTVAHSTHVSGTMIASGVSATRKGMSYQGTLKSYDWNTDLSEMATAAANRMRVSNHSYGFITGWYFDGVNWQWYGNLSVSTVEDYGYGFYSSEAQSVDNIAVNAPFYLVVKSAGNDRLYGPSSQPVAHGHSGSGSFSDTHNLSGAPSGYDCIGDYGVCKNILTVGAINDIPAGYSVPGDVVMSSFSGWGPLDDGRIKPDVVANGVNLSSSSTGSDASYAVMSGTSMASPNAAGSLGLLLQMRKIITGVNNPMRSSTLKGLVIHTADESGSNAGPDYAFGWGLMNTLKAAQVMRADSLAGMNKNIRELTLSQGQTIDVIVNSDGLQALRATICWIDPAGTPPTPSLDPPNLMLVNDLDLRVIGGLTYSPWVLNPASPATAATTGDNTRDNVEQVHIASPPAGQYTVRITHKGILNGGSQAVSLIVTGVTFGSVITVTSPNGGESWPIGSSQSLQWSSANVTGKVKVQLSRNGGSTFPEVLFDSTNNDGVENWTVTGPVSATARLRISSVVAPGVADSSNTNFSIVQPVVTVTAPNGGELWPIGQSQSIQWSSANFTGKVKVMLSRNGGSTFPEVLFDSTNNDGAENWTVTSPVSATARIRISSIVIPSVADTSNANFNIVQPVVTVTAPNGGETWLIGSSQSIQWSSANFTGKVKVMLSRNGGSTFPEVLFDSTNNDGAENWAVTGPVSATARIRISSIVILSVADTSNANFNIVQPSITVGSPNGGESWGIGSSHAIAWSSANVTGNVKIELSRNGGSTFTEVLFADTANDGSENWTVTGPVTSTARIRISSISSPAVADTSNANFSIGQPAITMVVPNGGETWHVDSTQTIQWTSAFMTGNVKIELSRNGGSSYQTIFLNTPDDGSENWTVTIPVTTQGCVRISSVNDTTVVDASNADFGIIQDASVSFSVLGSWNMLSVPLTVPDLRKTQVFPGSKSSAYAFESSAGYVSRDTLRYTEGYWLKYPSSQFLTIVGEVRTLDTIQVVQGWNMVGSISSPVDIDSVAQIPSGIVSSSFYFFDGSGYTVADSIHPGRSYWVKANQPGSLVLKQSGGPVPVSRPSKR